MESTPNLSTCCSVSVHKLFSRSRISRCYLSHLDTCLLEIRKQLAWQHSRHLPGTRDEHSEEGGQKPGCQMRQRAERRKEEGGEGGQRSRREFTSSRSSQVCACLCLCVPTCMVTRGCKCMNERKGGRQQIKTENQGVCERETSNFTPIKCNVTHS